MKCIAILTHQQDVHVDRVIQTFAQRTDARVVRINSEDLPQNILLNWGVSADGRTDGNIRIADTQFEFSTSELTAVWIRHPLPPRVPSLADEQDTRFATSQIVGLVNGIISLSPAVPVVNDPWAERRADNKVLQMSRARQRGLKVPPTMVTNDPEIARRFLESGENIYKVLVHPTQSLTPADFTMRVSSTIMLDAAHLSIIESIRYSPALFQRFQPKHREYRVTIVGNETFVCEIDPHRSLGGEVDWRDSGLDLHMVAGTLPTQLADELKRLVAEDFGLNFAAIDLILSPDGDYYFLDLNPSGQYLFVEEAVPELRITDAVCNLLAGF